MKSCLTEIIVSQLIKNRKLLQNQFKQTHPIKTARYFVLDNLLPNELAEKIYTEFPKKNAMKLLHSYGKLKLKYSWIKDASSLLQDIHFAIQDKKVVAVIEEITGIKNQIPDPAQRDGGVSMLLKGHYINPHIDNSHDVVTKKYYRTVNLLYYVTPNWHAQNGGNYELWDEMIENKIVVPCYFNRLLVMETNRQSWHSVSRIECHLPRCCVFNYFFSEYSPEKVDYYHGVFSNVFKARPEQIFRRKLDSFKEIIFKKILQKNKNAKITF